MDAERLATIRQLSDPNAPIDHGYVSVLRGAIAELCDALEAAQTELAEWQTGHRVKISTLQLEAERDAVQAERDHFRTGYETMRSSNHRGLEERERLQAENTRLTERLQHPEYEARLLRAVEAEPEMVVEVLELREERDRLARQVTDLKEAIRTHVVEFDRIVDETRLRPGSDCGPMLAEIIGDLVRNATPSEDQ